MLLMAYSDCSYDNTWFPDSGASNHVTTDSCNLLQENEYTTKKGYAFDIVAVV